MRNMDKSTVDRLSIWQYSEELCYKQKGHFMRDLYSFFKLSYPEDYDFVHELVDTLCWDLKENGLSNALNTVVARLYDTNDDGILTNFERRP
ncbi:uncharacterized protein LOC128232712 isoform X2 [Mya arenaria]|uniref:uncharacterized protein LOC128232712 isoform X2 n=1 Tax=Mya arenaria TaxID=6604 RepID=UPI0022E928C2|nr:uncharacterized protein LOC128232712 isoform X2 [Mya arenaria]